MTAREAKEVLQKAAQRSSKVIIQPERFPRSSDGDPVGKGRTEPAPLLITVPVAARGGRFGVKSSHFEEYQV